MAYVRTVLICAHLQTHFNELNYRVCFKEHRGTSRIRIDGNVKHEEDNVFKMTGIGEWVGGPPHLLML